MYVYIYIYMYMDTYIKCPPLEAPMYTSCSTAVRLL